MRQKFKAKIIAVNRKYDSEGREMISSDPHISENGIVSQKPDLSIYNSGSNLLSFHQQLEQFLLENMPHIGKRSRFNILRYEIYQMCVRLVRMQSDLLYIPAPIFDF